MSSEVKHDLYETKNITFHMIHVKVSSDSRCSRTLPMNVAIESAHCGCERNLCKDWALSERERDPMNKVDLEQLINKEDPL